MFHKELLSLLERDWHRWAEHPFIRAMEQGTLDKERFIYYLVQDVHYLKNYAKLLALGVVESESLTEMTEFAQQTLFILTDEMSLHRGYLAELGLTEEDAAAIPETEAAHAYSSFQLQEAKKGGIVELQVLLYACACSYLLLAQEIDQNHPEAKTHPVYGRWIQMYLSDSYAKSVEDMGIALDRVGPSLTADEKDALRDLFEASMQHELDFWDMAWQGPGEREW